LRTKALISLLVFLSFLAAPHILLAQYSIRDGVFVSGGGVHSGSYITYGCAGQAGVGAMTGSNVVELGFWFVAGLTSAVDVAVTLLSAQELEEGVRLTWELAADRSFQGVNIYRAQKSGGEHGDFRRINKEPLDTDENSYLDRDALPGNEYVYMISVVDGGLEKYSGELSVKLPPRPLTLYQNHPNPFNPSTTIRYYIPYRARVRLDIYDVTGRLVRRLVNTDQRAGRYEVGWDGRNEEGRNVDSGVYFYRLTACKKAITRKLVVLR